MENDTKSEAPTKPGEILGKRKREEPEMKPETQIKDEPTVKQGPTSLDEEDEEYDDDEVTSGDDEIERGEYQYSERQEKYPPFAAYNEAFPGIGEGLMAFFPEILSVFQAHPGLTENVQRFLTSMRDVKSIPKMKPIKIGVLGNAGAGAYLPEVNYQLIFLC